jgi:hypothetical protein
VTVARRSGREGSATARLGTLRGMGIMSTFAKAGVAKKVMDEARKPQNQKKVKDAISSFRNKDKGSGTTKRT